MAVHIIVTNFVNPKMYQKDARVKGNVCYGPTVSIQFNSIQFNSNTMAVHIIVTNFVNPKMSQKDARVKVNVRYDPTV